MDPEVEQVDAQDVDESSAESIPTTDAPKTMSDFIKTKREGLRAADESAPQKTAVEPEKAEREDEEEDKVETKSDDAKKPYTEEEMAELDLRNADPDRVPLALKKTVQKMQAAETRKHRELKEQMQELNELLARAKTQATAAPEVDAEDEELPFTKEEMRSMLRSKAGKQFLTETLKEIGIDPETSVELSDQRFMQSAVADAMGEFSKLGEQDFLEETIALIKETPRWAKTVETSKDKLTVSLIFQAAAGKIAEQRADSEREKLNADRKAAEDEKRKLKAAKEEKNRKPTSHAAGAQRKTTTVLGTKPTTLEFIKQQRESRS